MKDLLKKLKPHLIAVGIFVAVAFIYFHPVLEGKKLLQNDIIQYKGMAKELNDYRDKTGEEALWTNNMFGGMPGFMISTKYKGDLIRDYVYYPLVSLPQTVNIFFILMLGMYILLITFRVNPIIAVVGSISYAFTTYFIGSIEAGHTSKLVALAFLPMVLAGLKLIFDGKYMIGTTFTALASALEVTANHIQVTYYLLIIIVFYVGFQVYEGVKSGKTRYLMKPLTFALIAALLAGLANLGHLWTSYDFAKYTMRGGKSELKSDTDKKSSGLNKDYAMRWSQGKAETLTFMVPGLYGGSSSEHLDKASYLYEEMVKRGVSKNQAKGFVARVPLYWGDKPFTSSPHYLGAVVCLLIILGFYVTKGYLKWWLISVSTLGFMLAWGRHWEWFTDVFFYYVPMYNKFRAPEITLIIPTVCLIVLAFIGLNTFFNDNDLDKQKIIKNTIYTFLSIIGVIVLVIFSSDFVARGDAQFGQNKWLAELMVEQRRKIAFQDTFKSMAFAGIAIGLLYGYIKGKIKKQYTIILIGLLIIIDLFIVDKKYLNAENFVKPKNYENVFIPSEVDLQILQDNDPHYRVFNLTTNTFNDAMTSYHHKSVGGYNAAKLVRYQDMIDYHLSKNNLKVLNMLNTKYLVVPSKKDKKPIVRQNTDALGNAWFVKDIYWASDANEEIEYLNQFDPKQTVVIDKRYEHELNEEISEYSANGSINLTEYKPNHLTYDYKSSEQQFAVFSEVFYKGNEDWKAYIDGTYVPHMRVNYILRGMQLPSGNHQVEFKFEPVTYHVGGTISMVGSILIFLLMGSSIFIAIKKETTN